jgi:hypothetical protein
MARRIKKRPDQLQKLDRELSKIEEEENLFQHPSFLGNQRQFIDKLYTKLPSLADRLVTYLEAVPERVISSNGTVQMLVPEGAALTDGQLQLYKMILQKGLPNQQPVNMNGDQTQRADGKVHITINQSGPEIDFEQTGEVIQGVHTGQAKQVGTLSFKKPEVLN